jgi:hypothetical protein
MFLGLVGRPQNKKVHLARVGRNGVRAGPTWWTVSSPS